MHLNRRVLTAARALFTLTGLGALLYLLSSAGLMAELARSDATIFLGLALNQAAVLLVALRLGAVLRCFGIHLRPLDQWRIHLQSIFYYVFLPFGLGADVARFAKIAERSPEASRWSVAAGVMFDRMLGLATFLLLAAVSAPFVLTSGVLDIDIPPWLMVTVPLVLGLLAVAALLRWRDRVDLRRIAGAIRDRKRTIAAALALSIAMQTLMACAVYAAARSLSIDIGPLTILFVVAAAAAMQAIPATVAGAGMGEVAAVSLYIALGLGWREAVLLTAIDYGYRLLTAIMGGLWELFRIGVPAGVAGQPRTAAANRKAQ